MREFQSQTIDFVKNGIERVAILDPPTGSGKTYSFRKIGELEKKAIIVLPNNLLANEVLKSFSNNAIVLNKSTIIKNNNLRKRKYNLDRVRTSDTIEDMVSKNAYVLTNPTVFYYLLLNHYSEGQKDDMLSRIVSRNVKTIIFDEFHIYSKDQISMIMGLVLIIPKSIKIIFSSATPQDYFLDLCNNVFNADQVRKISVKRTYDQTDQNDLLQGPIQLNIIGKSTHDFLTENIQLLNEGKWALILDSLRNVNRVEKILESRYSKDEIAIISAYHDPSYSSYSKSLENDSNLRIIISTNIIEQGINIDKQYTNFIIEPGLSINNTIQRIGRVGRGISSQSKIYFCLESGFLPPDAQGDTIDDIYNAFRAMAFPKRVQPPNPFGIGVYLSILLERLSGLAQSKIYGNLQGYGNKKVLAGLYSCRNVDETFSNDDGVRTIRRNCVPEIMTIKKWWPVYKKTIYNFISDQSQKVNLTDEEYDFEDNFLKTEYDEIWINKNKDILSITDKGYVVGAFNKKPRYDFNIAIQNLPDGQRKMPYSEIAFSAKRTIMDDIKALVEGNYCVGNDKIELLIKDILSVVKETAGLERLKLEVIND